jgi:F-type H+-transporting ATPase subunit b
MTTGTSVFLLPNGTFFVELAVTIILIVAFSKWLLPPLTKAMAARQEQVRASLEAAERARMDAEAADDERHHVLEEARVQAREIVAMAQQTADQLRADATVRAQAEYDRIVAAAAADVQLARQRAVDEAAARLGEVVIEVVSKVVGREINAESHRDLIDEAIAALAEESRRAAGQPR